MLKKVLLAAAFALTPIAFGDSASAHHGCGYAAPVVAYHPPVVVAYRAPVVVGYRAVPYRHYGYRSSYWGYPTPYRSYYRPRYGYGVGYGYYGYGTALGVGPGFSMSIGF